MGAVVCGAAWCGVVLECRAVWYDIVCTTAQCDVILWHVLCYTVVCYMWHDVMPHRRCGNMYVVGCVSCNVCGVCGMILWCGMCGILCRTVYGVICVVCCIWYHV